MATLRILNHRGDTPVMWDVQDEASVAEAISLFEAEMTGTGSIAFVSEPGKPDYVSRSFVREATEIIISPPFAGG